MHPPIPALDSDNPIICVLIVDDNLQVRQELRRLLELTEGMVVVGEAGDGQEAILQAEQLHPDVIIMDLEMPILDGLQATRQIKQRKIAKRVVILSVHSEPEDLERAMQAGADAYIQKGSPYFTLIASIQPNKIQKGEIK